MVDLPGRVGEDADNIPSATRGEKQITGCYTVEDVKMFRAADHVCHPEPFLVPA